MDNITRDYWNDYHKRVLNDMEYDDDLNGFLKRFYLSDKEPKTILELGCGQGKDITYISEQHQDWNCYACDYSWRALHRLNYKNLGKKNLLIRQALAEKTEYPDNKFDIVFECVLLASNSNYIEIIKEMYRILKPKGRFFIKELSDNDCNKDNKFLRRGSDTILFNEKALYNIMIENGFERVETSKVKLVSQNLEYIVCIGRKI